MKINVEFDLTPDEFRRSLGLPDVEAFQQDLLNRIYKQMESGVEGYDPMSLMQPFLQQQGLPQGLTQGLSQGLASFGTYQQMMLDMLRQAGSGAGKSRAGTAETESGGDGKQKGEKVKEPPGRAAKKTASARSRSRRSE
ncbi:hypothetical protein [Billgrantia endophytica]|uniref:Uncharacterized protein n=1 Tax=Billgrantia endophytica TaxID=2033802 RepID=A0A2N7U0B9_9GAMM|nr:hypothetical protein [Halomonas endophytica]PMR73880.1 hypothetical protein C1H69_16280 [Halomonas endophytica]